MVRNIISNIETNTFCTRWTRPTMNLSSQSCGAWIPRKHFKSLPIVKRKNDAAGTLPSVECRLRLPTTNRCCTIHAYRTDTTLVHEELLASPQRVTCVIPTCTHMTRLKCPRWQSAQARLSPPDQERHDVLRCAGGQGVLTG